MHIYKINYIDYINGINNVFYVNIDCHNMFNIICDYIKQDNTILKASDYSDIIFDVLDNINVNESDNIYNEYSIEIDFNYIHVFNDTNSFHYNIQQKHGICIDKYVSHVLEPKLNNMYVILNNIKNCNRKNLKTYINSIQYEKDFNSLINLKHNAEQIIKYCVKTLEHLSDTKTNEKY